MTNVDPKSKKILWGKSIMNGLLAFIIGLILYMIPSLVIGLKMGFELGPQLQDSAAVGAEISRTISTMYRDNVYLSFLYIVFTALAVFWRAKVLARLPNVHEMTNGAIIGGVPAVVSLISLFISRFDILSIVEIIVFVGVGILAGAKKSQEGQ